MTKLYLYDYTIIFKPTGLKHEVDNQGDGDETDLINMADVNLENEAKNLKRADVGTEVRNAPGGDEQIYVNKQGNFSSILKLTFS